VGWAAPQPNAWHNHPTLPTPPSHTSTPFEPLNYHPITQHPWPPHLRPTTCFQRKPHAHTSPSHTQPHTPSRSPHPRHHLFLAKTPHPCTTERNNRPRQDHSSDHFPRLGNRTTTIQRYQHTPRKYTRNTPKIHTRVLARYCHPLFSEKTPRRHVPTPHPQPTSHPIRFEGLPEAFYTKAPRLTYRPTADETLSTAARSSPIPIPNPVFSPLPKLR